MPFLTHYKKLYVFEISGGILSKRLGLELFILVILNVNTSARLELLLVELSRKFSINCDYEIIFINNRCANNV